MRRVSPLHNEQLPDVDAERIRRKHHDAIAELQKIAQAGPVTIANISLADAAPVSIAHKLGRRPVFVSLSAPRDAVAAGYVNEHLDRRTDKVIVLQADDFGATITVDIEVR